MHLGLLDSTPSLAVIAGWAGGYQVIPGMLPSHVAWDDVVDSQEINSLPAVLAGVVIPSQNFTLG